MIEFGLLKAKNIMSFGSGGFEIDFSENRLTGIRGKSGHGKSTIIEALTYCLFGKPYRNVKVSQLINSINGKGLYTELEFKNGVDSYRVVRGIKPNIFEIYKNGDLIEEEAASRDYQKILESILGFGYKTFKQVCIIGSAGYTQFMSLSSGERRSMIEELLDIKIFSKMSAYFKDLYSVVKKDIEKLDIRIQSKKEEISRLENLLTDIRDSEEKKKTSILSSIDDIKEQIEVLENKKKSYVELKEEFDRKIGELANPSKTIQEKTFAVREIKTKISQLKETKSFFHDTENCSVCKQAIDETHKKSIITECESKIASEIELGKKLMQEIEDLEEQSKVYEEFEEKLELLISKISQTESKKSELSSNLKILQRDLDKPNDSDKVFTQKNQVESEVSSLIEEKTEKATEFDYLDACVNLLKDSGIKAKIISYFVPVLNDLINRYLESFDLFVNFELDENFDETIKSRHRDSFSYESFSEGEKQRIDLAILFSWREIARQRNSASTNLLIFDETCDRSLDDDSINSFMDFLRDEVQSNVVIITHRQVDPVYFDEFIHVKKNSDGYSIIEKEK